MDISRQAFDLKPFLIRQGALLLWGVPLTRQADVYRIRQLYKLSNFFAEVCYDPATGQPIGICSFSSVDLQQYSGDFLGGH
ncbi:hypothetical protein [Spirosoma pollinicola]|uniref:Uncharacterized protein n=1 Tax=Spirosoma pollinicola TaxID=2057025 RepID=A0A2K8Z8R5_9BACT|nr:hypothetical protein [Spirosoma pollinicola]AUD06261.1 hypothetical protein CWM47_33100 [Spirosoma pollinicola]